ncbi:gene transfer agent family protein [Sphingomonas sp. TREG-RG-20F-R18-01]|uniref:gene transfer agent family protein n=1 Tax=Sphingomonas sp. TREG-RG-20F-R18-01 TaxID=2914982 RepID=UPI001F59D5FC|nr:gene transfer agent family protein [Sphingomonas sp. TREG-RG-20F-R18-01]
MTRVKKAAVPPQPTANDERGEHELTLAGTVYVLRPSHTALKAIEKQTGVSTLALIRTGNTGEMTLEQLGIVAAELIRAGAQDELTRHVGAERIGEFIFEEGIGPAMARITLCLFDAATGGRDTAGNVKAAAA